MRLLCLSKGDVASVPVLISKGGVAFVFLLPLEVSGYYNGQF